MSSSYSPPESGPAPVLRKVSKLFLIEGIILIVLGVLAIALPVIATFALTILFGWLFFIGGVVGLVTSFWSRQAPGFWWSLLSAALGIVVGLLLIAQPATGALSLTFLLVAFFLAEGAVTIMFAISHRGELEGRWIFMLASGIVTLVLAVLILMGLPGTAAWALGLLVGVDLLFGGIALIAMGSAAGKAA
ncbi:MAG TPA: HdeD family acid-resistance protein [Xanthobacteraceae bacterium]|nr:HdeD family acid-resistance protein [Xanthobacteraceae bacterium]